MHHIVRPTTKLLRAGRNALVQHAMRGRELGNPMALVDVEGTVVDTFDDLAYKAKDASMFEVGQARLAAALRRDALYSTGGAVFLRSLGVRQAFREMFDFGAALSEAGVHKSESGS